MTNRLLSQGIRLTLSDSARTQQTLTHSLNADTPYTSLRGKGIHPGIDKNGAQLLKRIPGAVVYDRGDLMYQHQSFMVNGLGERYNQVLLNGAPLGSSDNLSRAFPFAGLPAEAIEGIKLQKYMPSLPGDVTGGTISIDLIDKTDTNFIYILAGGGYSDQTSGKDFYGSDRNAFEWLGYPGRARNLPTGFPNTRAQLSLSQLNPQEKIYWSRQLRNNLAPVNEGATAPDSRAMLGFGRSLRFKKGEQLSVMAWLNHQRSNRIDAVERQVAPDLNQSLIRSQSQDISYLYQVQSSAIITASLAFNRSKISFKSLYGNQYADAYTQRSQLYKPDEDSLAHAGMHYATSQRSWLHSTVSGAHALGTEGKLKLDWLASYSYSNQFNPDERSFLLRIDSVNGDRFEIARPSAASQSSAEAIFTNSGRLWRQQKDHAFTGTANLSFPFRLFHHTQTLQGGVFIQNQYRVLYSDLFTVNGTGYVPVDSLLAAERYYPGGLQAINFYEKYNSSSGIIIPDQVTVKNRGNYTASSNIGAVFIKLTNIITNSLWLDWGIRVESASTLVSSSQYNFFQTYKNPQLGTLDENDHVIDFRFLPSIMAQYRLLKNLQVHASFSQTVNRPALQELSRYRIYDPLSFTVRTGNTLLNATNVRNYAAGVQLQTGPGFDFQLSGFYKEIQQPIEYVLSSYASAKGNLLSTPHNVPPAMVRGLTATLQTDFRFISDNPFWKYVSFFANGSLLRSKVESNSIRSTSTPEVREHSLSGTPDYTVNAGLVIQHPRYPNLAVLYNRTDDYITAVGSGLVYQASEGAVRAIPDYRVKGRDQLDLQLSQRFFKSRIQLIAGVNNLTSSDYTVYQDLNGNKKFDTPLKLENRNNTGGFFQTGIDNTVMHVASQRTYYVTVSYLFK